MKTLTEFNGFTLKNALRTHAELSAAGKTPEEVQAGMGEALKLEGDKLKFFLHALEHVKAKPDNIKRVLVMTLTEGEKAPNGAVQKEEQYYLTEFFPSPHQKKTHGDRDERGGRRDGKRGRGKGKGRGGRDGRDGRGGGRGPRRDGAPGEAQAGGRDGVPGAGGPRPPRGDRPPRGPRGGGDRPSGGPKIVIKPVVKAEDGAAKAEAPAAESAAKTD